MATKSICKNIKIKDRNLAKGLILALENAKNKGSKEVKFNNLVEEVKGEDIKKYFEV